MTTNPTDTVPAVTTVTTGTDAATALESVRASVAAAEAAVGLNGFTHRDDAAALARAEALDAGATRGAGGPLAGWTVAVKDNIHVAGLPNTAGTPALRSFTPTVSSPVVDAIEEAGAIVVGKANMHELAFGVSSNNVAFGAVGNPAALGRTAGGSSGGSAALVAAGVSRIALGTDTGGSVRVPAALTGIAGLRPSTGRWPGGEVTPLSRTRDTVGVMARTVSELSAVDAAVTGEAIALVPQPDGVRLLVAGELCDDLDPVVAAAWPAALERLRGRGVELLEVTVADLIELDGEWGMPVVFAEAYEELEEYLARYVPHVSLDDLVTQVAMPDVKATLQGGRLRAGTEAAVRSDALVAREALRAGYAALLSAHAADAIVFPTVPVVAPVLGAQDAELELRGRLRPTFPTVIRNTALGSFAGVPGVTVPLPGPQLPVGFALDGPVGGDAALLAVATCLEEALAVD